MAETITIRWTRPSDADRFRVRRTLDWETWTELAAAQAASGVGASPVAALAADADYGDATLNLTANALSASGYGWLDDALVQWTAKSGDNLTGVTWHSGYGTYAAGSPVREATEAYTDSGVTPTNLAVVYEITNIDAEDRESPPAFLWYFYPSKPASPEHCVVLVAEWADLGLTPLANVQISVYLTNDDEFASVGGGHLNSNPANIITTNVLGLAEAQCWKNAARIAQDGGAPRSYTFVINKNSGPLNVPVDNVPDDLNFAHLKDLSA